VANAPSCVLKPISYRTLQAKAVVDSCPLPCYRAVHPNAEIPRSGGDASQICGGV